MTTRPRRDVVARLVSNKRSSYKEESFDSSSESSEEVVQLPDVEDRSYEQVQEEAGRCSHGPPTDYPCHICCYNKWNKTRRLEQPSVEKAKGKLAAGGDNDVILIKATSEPLIGGSNAETRESVKSKEKKREHSEASGRDGADILFDGFKVGHKAKKTDDGGLEKPTKVGGKSYTYNSLPGITITNLGPPQASSGSKGAKEHITQQEQEEMVKIVKKTNWAEVFRLSGVAIAKPATATTGKEEVTLEEADQVGQTFKEWECSFCTFHNTEEDLNTCRMCRGERNKTCQEEKTTLGDIMGKQCPACTLINKSDCKTCAACDGVLH